MNHPHHQLASRKIENFHFFLNDGYPFPETCYGLGGIRKSYFYNCPRLSSITGETEEHNIVLSTTFNTVYINFWYRHSIPLYVYNHYTAIIDDRVFTEAGTWVYTVLYNPDTLEAYVPFLNDGLENISIKPRSAVVIAGMGSKTILHILKQEKEKKT